MEISDFEISLRELKERIARLSQAARKRRLDITSVILEMLEDLEFDTFEKDGKIYVSDNEECERFVILIDTEANEIEPEDVSIERVENWEFA